MTSDIKANAATLATEMEWLRLLIDARLRLFFNDNPPVPSIPDITPPILQNGTAYANFIIEKRIGTPERIILLLALAPHIKPEILDGFLTKNTTYDKRFTEFGGVISPVQTFLPTGETALFLLGGSHLEQRFTYYNLLSPEHFFIKQKILVLEAGGKGEPFLNSRLLLANTYVHYFITGQMGKPVFDELFPARQITTSLNWEDVVLPTQTQQGIAEISDWIEHGDSVMSTSLGKRLKPGYKALFYGPPGTGKTLTASLLGKNTGHDVYRIDLSLIVSKYIGETEKNLSRVFDEADNKNWILFFDEADALFGKRTDVSSSHDRYANQEVAYLLQRIEEHAGVVILASNLKDNIDKAFVRRFQSVIHFPMPGTAERHTIWQQSFAENLPPAPEVNLQQIAEKYVLAGGPMMNVIRNCSLRAIKQGHKTITSADLENSIRKELSKDGIILT